MSSKEATIKSFLEDCCPEAFALTTSHCESLPWRYCALSEVVLRLPFLWLRSSVQGGASTSAITIPNESTLTIDWSLPLGPAGQEHLFHRIYKDYEVWRSKSLRR